jgi:hypothetical protein
VKRVSKDITCGTDRKAKGMVSDGHTVRLAETALHPRNTIYQRDCLSIFLISAGLEFRTFIGVE